jgi:hypothetical protein
MTTILPLSLELTPAEIGLVAERRLHGSPYYFLKSLSCQCDAGVVTLRGNVPNARLSKIAESIVTRVPGVRTVVNLVQIVDPMRPFAAPELRNAG